MTWAEFTATLLSLAIVVITRLIDKHFPGGRSEPTATAPRPPASTEVEWVDDDDDPAKHPPPHPPGP